MTAAFHLSDAHLLHIEKRMLAEVNRGLAAATNADANVKAFCTCVIRSPLIGNVICTHLTGVLSLL